MSEARIKILNAIQMANTEISDVELQDIEAIRYLNKTQQFIQILESIGAVVKPVEALDEVISYLDEQIAEGKKVVNVLKDELINLSKESLYDVDLALMKGGIAVAENGAVWMSELNMGSRVLPFSCQHLLLLVEEKNIVDNMHDAYEKINLNDSGYGVFIAGPSKTADIEQSLVIGAHGPIDLTVFLI
jgi:L-lactate dehydrogenase complex protein LldG